MIKEFIDAVVFLVQYNFQQFLELLDIAGRLSYAQAQTQILAANLQIAATQAAEALRQFLLLQQQAALEQFAPIITQWEKLVQIVNILKK